MMSLGLWCSVVSELFNVPSCASGGPSSITYGANAESVLTV